MPFLKEVFKLIGMAKVSYSAREARSYGFLREQDPIVMHRDLVLPKAKQCALALAESGYQPPREPMIQMLGQTGFSALKLMLYIMDEANFVSPYDVVIGEKIAEVMTGGDLSEPQMVPESYVMRREREAFVDLLKDKRTIDRVEHMLTKGKPLRN